MKVFKLTELMDSWGGLWITIIAVCEKRDGEYICYVKDEHLYENPGMKGELGYYIMRGPETDEFIRDKVLAVSSPKYKYDPLSAFRIDYNPCAHQEIIRKAMEAM